MPLRLVPTDTTLDFMALARPFAMLSAALCLVAVLATAVIGLNLGIDFRGGAVIMAETPGPVDIADYRAAVTALDIGDVSVTSISTPGSAVSAGEEAAVMVRIGADDPNAAAAAATAALTESIPDVAILQTDAVGAKVSGELLQAGAIAVLLAVGAILFYIWVRFEWQFSVGAVVALTHDVVLTVGVYALTQIEFNLAIIAALLTIVGYSLNDTVVVYDRVRENLRRYKTKPLAEVLNLSLNETLSRTLMTSVTTLLALIALYVLGGEVIRGFTFGMIWGVIVGTYSSIFVAAAALLYFGVTREPLDADKAAGVKFGDPDAP